MKILRAILIMILLGISRTGAWAQDPTPTVAAPVNVEDHTLKTGTVKVDKIRGN